LTDDQTQPRIRSEAQAIERILAVVQQQRIQWTASEALADEIDRNPSFGRRLESARY
jgi:hypothetical protein